jgi:hypothetical protein
MSSLTNPLFLDLSSLPYEITSSSISWLDEGFRIGDQVLMQVWQGTSGVPINSQTTSVDYVDDAILGVSAMAFWYDVAADQYMTITVANRNRSDLETLFNHSLNSTAGTEFSLIDGEVTRAMFLGLETLGIGNTQVAVLTGNQSGQFLISAEITRLADPYANERGYNLKFTFINSGVYDSAWFASSNCLKTFVKIFWSSLAGEVDRRKIVVISPSANTGFYEQGHNNDTIDSFLIQGITDLNYSAPSSHQIIVDGPIPDIGIGSFYIPLDETYYKNRIYSQNRLTMAVASTDLSVGSLPSFLNESGAGYTITIDGYASGVSITVIDITFTPNPAFTAFMDAREIGDRLFNLWVKCGNVNLLAYNDQLQFIPVAGTPLVIDGETAYFDHAENVTELISFADDLEFNTEDEVGYFGYFMLDKFALIESFSAKIEAFSSSTQGDFTLLEIAFSFNGIPISGDGRYLLNQTMVVSPSLPTTSLKREAKLYLIPAYDTVLQYAVGIYFPFILDWKYWLAQTNADVDFYPTQNKNWQQYDGVIGDWEVQMELSLVENSIAHNYTKDIVIKPYDSEPFIDQDIQLYIDSSNLNVGIVTEGLLMRIVATHTLTNGNAWNQNNIWGEISVEPKESVPRRILSTVVPFDNDLSNPLKPLSGLLMAITYPTPFIARMECYFNPDLINLENGCKFTTKIKGCTELVPIFKIMTDGTEKLTTDDENKIIA